MELEIPSNFQRRWEGGVEEDNGESSQEGQQAQWGEGNSYRPEIGEEVMAAKGTATQHATISYSSKKGKETKHGKRKGSATPGDHSNSLKVR